MKTSPPLSRRTLSHLLTLAPLLLFAACQPKPESSRGFRLPDGDVEKGKAAFVQLKCHFCHKVSGVELPPPPMISRIDVPLGGEILRVKTYGELVTSIINPDHVVTPKYRDALTNPDGTSIMPDNNANTSVAQMIDLVAFLQSRYKLLEPEYSDYYFP